MDDAVSGLVETEEEAIRLNEPEVDVYAWISNDENNEYAGVARTGNACGTRKSSLTKGPSYTVVATASVN